MFSITAITMILLGKNIANLSFGPTTTPEPIPEVRMLAVGDIMLDRAVASHMKKYGDNSILQKLDDMNFFDNYDLITGNLEGAVADYRRQTSKSIAFNFSAESVNTLMDYGFNLVTLANNHSYDMGKTAFNETRTTLNEIGLEFYGEQYSIDEDALFLKEVDGIKFAFVGLNDTNSFVDRADVLPLLENAEQNADYTLVNIHWGQEYKLLSNSHQQDLAHFMIDNGADVIIGHHPHVVQEMEIYKNRPIYYSLGNFIFDQYFSEETQQGLGLEFVFKPTEFTITPHAFKSVVSEVELIDDNAANQLFNRVYESVDDSKYLTLDEKQSFQTIYKPKL